MPFPETYRPTQKISRGQLITPRGVVFHHSCGSFEGGIDWIVNHPEAGGSYHCLINTDGERVVFANDRRRAWHAGRSAWGGQPDCNSFMLGCAFTGDTNHRALTEAEMASAAEWLFEPPSGARGALSRFTLWAMTLDDLTDHRTVALPAGRKDDLHPRELERLMAYLARRAPRPQEAAV
jgi:hypothetical protein